jgi:hypothetical protein
LGTTFEFKFDKPATEDCVKAEASGWMGSLQQMIKRIKWKLKITLGDDPDYLLPRL